MRCIAFASPPSWAFLDATEYSFDPAPSDEKRRRDRIKLLLGNRLSDIYGRLPLELWLSVAEELIYECAISMAQILWQDRSSVDCEVDISRGVWVRYICIDGARYIADLSNTAKPGSGSTEVLSLCNVSEINVLYSLEDHLGIRRLVFSSRKDEAELPSFRGNEKGSSLWWQTIPLGSKELEAISDVSYRECLIILFPFLLTFAGFRD